MSAHVRSVDSAAQIEFDSQTRRSRALRTFFALKRSKARALRAFSHIVRAQAEPKAQTQNRSPVFCRLLL
jgi:hypothetical protein